VRFPALALCLVCAALAQSPAPAPDRVLETARSWALQYARTLPDFLCTELIHRYADWQGPEFRLDTLTLQLTFSQQGDKYKLVARDNHPTSQNVESLNGSFSSGEFGSALFLIFTPDSEAAFEPQPPSRLRRHPVAVYSFTVAHAHSHYLLHYGTEEALTAYHGRVFIDTATSRVIRLAMDVDPPPGFPIRECSTVVDYDWRDIGGTRYLLPVHADVRTTERNREHPVVAGRRMTQLSGSPMRYHNVVEFRDYHKFEIETKLGFGQ
jgi:hypothetical protein